MNASNVADLTIAEGTAGDGDTLTVVGSAQSETINVTPTGVTVGALQRIDFTAANVEALNVDAGEGNDNITVDPGSVPVFVDGGDPIGSIGDGAGRGGPRPCWGYRR